MSNAQQILFVAAELTPLAKVGGLADVIGALPKALYGLGVDVRIVIPKYGIIDETKYPMEELDHSVSVYFNGKQETVGIFETTLPDSLVPVYLLDNERYLGQNGVYFEKDASAGGSNREAERFSFLARASLEIFQPLNWYPHLIHCHDWHVSLVPVLLNALEKGRPKLQAIKTLLTIHNLEYQGVYQAAAIYRALGIDANVFPAVQPGDATINSLRQAILESDYLNTVSPAYAQEILTPEFGAGLDDALRQRQSQLVGLLNGIDVERFNPARDTDIAATYSADDPSGKAACKTDLQRRLGLPERADAPLFGVVSRLAEQKGFPLIIDNAKTIAAAGGQLVILGTGDPQLEQQIQALADQYPESVKCAIKFDAALAQQIYAGSDYFLMPSRFEPCGLGQMIAMRYGTVPIVRATGGLKDTVHEINADESTGEGFVFTEFTAAGLRGAIERALALYQNSEAWHTVRTQLMRLDFSWNHSAQEYYNLYQSLIEGHG